MSRSDKPSLPSPEVELASFLSLIISSWPQLPEEGLRGPEDYQLYEKSHSITFTMRAEILESIIDCLACTYDELRDDPIEMEVVIGGDPATVSEVKDSLTRLLNSTQGREKGT